MGFPLRFSALLVAAAFQSGDKALYPSSVVGTEFDFIVDSDPDMSSGLESRGKRKAEMPDKTNKDAPLVQEAFVFTASFRDGTSLSIAVDADFATEEDARKEALRYTPRLGKLPTALRKGLRRVVVHKGGVDATAFSDVGLIVIYSENATKRIGTHDLEETLFHESVHAAWDDPHEKEAEWRGAQKSDGRFVTDYARKNPNEEDLAESALFAFALIHHPERIPKDEASKIRAAIPARIAYVEKLLPKGKPLQYNVCLVDLTRPGQMSDVLSNALTRGLAMDSTKVREFLDGASGKHKTGDALLQATAQNFSIDAPKLKAEVEKFRHVNCKHGELGAVLAAPPK